MDDFRSFGKTEASGRVGTIDWDRGIHRKRAPEGSGAPGGRGGNDISVSSVLSKIRIPDRIF